MRSQSTDKKQTSLNKKIYWTANIVLQKVFPRPSGVVGNCSSLKVSDTINSDDTVVSTSKDI